MLDVAPCPGRLPDALVDPLPPLPPIDDPVEPVPGPASTATRFPSGAPHWFNVKSPSSGNVTPMRAQTHAHLQSIIPAVRPIMSLSSL
jgi:hypothetical protein